MNIIDGKYKALDNDIFETFYCSDDRTWSPAKYIVFVMANTVCDLGCRNCHAVKQKEERWMSSLDLLRRLEYILLFENSSNGKFSITYSYADFFLSPYKYDILDMCQQEGHVVNVYSYFPQAIDLDEIKSMKRKYTNLILSWSLHGLSDNNRNRMFDNPHLIQKIKPLICAEYKYLNCVATFSTLINNRNKAKWESFLKDFTETCNINFLNFIDYRNNKYFCKNIECTQLSHYHCSPIRYDLLHYLTQEDFEIVRLKEVMLDI